MLYCNKSAGREYRNAQSLVGANNLFYLCIAGINTDFSDARRTFLPEEVRDSLPEAVRDFVGTDVSDGNRATFSGRSICFELFIAGGLFQSVSGFPR